MGLTSKDGSDGSEGSEGKEGGSDRILALTEIMPEPQVKIPVTDFNMGHYADKPKVSPLQVFAF